ncbi:MAG: biopolymer transporter ExbD [Alistipes sp.]|nr:biopolymer transporter ExbD [Alistipes sp.]
MAIKRGSKVDKSFSSSAMTDLMFLLLIFMLIATTLITPTNALKLDLPKSSNQLSDKKITAVSIKHDKVMDSYYYYVEDVAVAGIKGIEKELQTRLQEQKEPTVSLHCDKSVAVDEVVKVMNIAKGNGYRLILATQAE